MENLYSELNHQREHLVGAEGKDREMIMSGINRLLDSLLDASLEIPTQLPSSPEGQAHLEKGRE